MAMMISSTWCFRRAPGDPRAVPDGTPSIRVSDLRTVVVDEADLDHPSPGSPGSPHDHQPRRPGPHDQDTPVGFRQLRPRISFRSG